MPKTIDDLVNICMADTLPSIPVIADYFGLHNCEDNKIPIILGIYQKMLSPSAFNIDKSIIEQAFLNNKLDELIHDTYQKNGTTGYYKIFCEKNITVNNIYLKN